MLTENEITIGLATILVFGIGAPWVARRTGIPSLLLLVPSGPLAGDILGRSHVLNVAGRVAAASSVPVPLRSTGRAFAADVTRREIGSMYGAGGVIRNAALPLPDGAIMLAAIHVDGTVDLQADEAAVPPEATVIAHIPAGS